MAIRQEINGRVLVITIDNPEVKNAFEKATIDGLLDIFDAVSFRDPLPSDNALALDKAGQLDIGEGGQYRPHAIVLQSSGNVFCAGAHLGEMKQLGALDYQTNLAAAMDMGLMFRAVRNCPVPVVVRVQGAAFGGGVGLVAASDIVVAGPAAKFCFSEVKLGLVPGVISPLVIDRIGQAAARRYFLTSTVFGLEEAYRIGLVDCPVASENGDEGDVLLDAAVSQVVNDLLVGGPEALAMCKSLLEGAQALGFTRSSELTARMIAEARTSQEAQGALAAFLNKEKSPWVKDEKWVL
jgi:methylglutaconyl-CoA hydratase